MATFTVEQLTTKTTKEEVAQQILDYMAGLDLPVTSWVALSPLRVLVYAFAALFAVLQNLVVDAVRGGFLDTADSNWLPVLSKQQYGVDAISATFATGTDCLVLNNAGGGIYDYNPGEFVLKNPANDKTYTNTNVIHIGALATGVLGSLQATEIGASSNMAAGQLIALVTQAQGVTPVLVGNIVGQDDEQPDALRQRDLSSLGARSPNGAAGAYEYVALTPALNGGISVNRAKRVPPPGDGTLQIVVASPAGPVSLGDLAILQGKFNELCTPETVTTTAVSATPVALAYNTTIHVGVKGAPDDATLTTMVRNALTAFVNGSATVAPWPIGGKLGGVPWRTVIGVIENSSPDGGATKPVISASLATETDIALAFTDVATLDPLSVTVTIIRDVAS